MNLIKQERLRLLLQRKYGDQDLKVSEKKKISSD